MPGDSEHTCTDISFMTTASSCQATKLGTREHIDTYIQMTHKACRNRPALVTCFRNDNSSACTCHRWQKWIVTTVVCARAKHASGSTADSRSNHLMHTRAVSTISMDNSEPFLKHSRRNRQTSQAPHADAPDTSQVIDHLQQTFLTSHSSIGADRHHLLSLCLRR